MTVPPEPATSDAAGRRAQRRAFIRAAHPDAGGDPDEFVRGLAVFDAGPGPVPAALRPTVYRSRRADRVVVHTIRGLRRRLAGRPPRRLE